MQETRSIYTYDIFFKTQVIVFPVEFLHEKTYHRLENQN